MAATSHGSSPSTEPISPCSGPYWRASTPSPGSATTTSRHGSTPDHPTASKKPTAAANACSRLIVKLRGHGLIAKVPRARLYRVTPYGYRVLNAAISVHDHSFPAAYLAAA